MFTKALLATMLTLLLASVGFGAEPAKTVPQPAPAATAPSSTANAVQSAPAAEAAKAAAPAAPAPVTKVRPNRAITITMFLAIIGVTLCVVVWAAKQTTSAADFYAAG